MNPSAFLRGQLASVGILLDEPTPMPAREFEPTAPAEPVDRDAVRAILVEAGAPVRALDWMVASCPSVELALTYRPTVRSAWCATCDGVVECDDGGCLPCQRIMEMP